MEAHSSSRALPLCTSISGSALVTVVHARSSATRLRNANGKGTHSQKVCVCVCVGILGVRGGRGQLVLEWVWARGVLC